MSILTFYTGKIGDSGIDGENGTGVADIDGSKVDNPTFDILYNNVESKVGDLTFDRTGEALITDRYGDFVFVSSDDITNYIPESNDFSTYLDAANNWTLDSSNNLDPFGGSTGAYISLDLDIASGALFAIETSVAGLSIAYHTVSFWFKVVSGTITALEVTIGTDNFKLNSALTSDWQRVSVSTEVAASSALVNIIPVGTAGAVIGLYGVQFENGSVAHDYLETTGSPVTIPNPESAARSNEFGYLIEGQKQNLIINSENLSRSNWTVSGGALTQYQFEAPFGDYYQYINIAWQTNPITTITSTGTFTEGVEYTVSFFIQANSSITLLTASLAGGTAIDVIGGSGIAFDNISSSTFTRAWTKVTAGASGDLIITGTSPDTNGVMQILGFQVETEGLSSYIRNASNANTRPEDDVNAPYIIPRPDEAWTCMFKLVGVNDDTEIKYIFNNGLTGGDEFSMYISDELLGINIGGTVSALPVSLLPNSVCVSFDGSSLKLYQDGLLSSSTTNIGTVSAIATTLYIGSDEANSNSINAFLSVFKFYEGELSANDIRYLTGV